jgi:hypothetical protein
MSKSNPPSYKPSADATDVKSRTAEVAPIEPEAIIRDIAGQLGWVNYNGPTTNSAISIAGPQYKQYILTFGPMMNNGDAPIAVSANILIGTASLSPGGASLHTLSLSPDPANVQPGAPNQLLPRTLNPGQQTSWTCITLAANIEIPCSILAQGFVPGGAPPNLLLTNPLNAFHVFES